MNIKQVIFYLDLTFDLDKGEPKPNSKKKNDNNIPIYINILERLLCPIYSIFSIIYIKELRLVVS